MSDVRLQREHEHELFQAARRWFTGRCGEINAAYREAVEQRNRDHDAEFDKLRDQRQELLCIRPRTPDVTAEIAAVEQAMRDHKKTPRPDTSDLDAIRQAEISRCDSILATALNSIRNRAVRGELDSRMQWHEPTQSFRIPELETTNG